MFVSAVAKILLLAKGQSRTAAEIARQQSMQRTQNKAPSLITKLPISLFIKLVRYEEMLNCDDNVYDEMDDSIDDTLRRFI